MHKPQQRGFIQNFIIPGIILIGVVIAGIAMLASNSGGTDTSNEKAAMEANALLGQALTVASAVQRAAADGAIAAEATVYSASSGVTLQQLLVDGKYLTALPAISDKAAPGNSKGWELHHMQVQARYPDGSNVGTEAMDDVLVLQGLTPAVAARVNNKLYGVPVNVAQLDIGALAEKVILAGLGIGNAVAGTGAGEGGTSGYIPGGLYDALGVVQGPAVAISMPAGTVLEGVVSSDGLVYTYYKVLNIR